MKFEYFNDMHKWLKKTFPNISFTFMCDGEREKYANRCYTNGIDTVYIGQYADPQKCVYSIFHEIGHIKCVNYEAMSAYEIEEWAWKYANALMDKYHIIITAGMRSYMLKQLATYDKDEYKTHKNNVPYDIKAITLSYTKEELLNNYDSKTDKCKTLKCPYCGSTDVESDKFFVDTSVINVVHVVCKQCHKVGINVTGAYHK